MDTDSDLSVYRRALHFSLAGEAERAALRTSKECCFQCDPSVSVRIITYGLRVATGR